MSDRKSNIKRSSNNNTQQSQSTPQQQSGSQEGEGITLNDLIGRKYQLQDEVMEKFQELRNLENKINTAIINQQFDKIKKLEEILKDQKSKSEQSQTDHQQHRGPRVEECDE